MKSAVETMITYVDTQMVPVRADVGAQQAQHRCSKPAISCMVRSPH